MSQRFQKIPFSLPRYLAQYQANQTNQPLLESKGNLRLMVNRDSLFGRAVINSVEISQFPDTSEENLFLLVSNYTGDHYNIPRGHRYFLTINNTRKKSIARALQEDFNQNLIAFVSGAEFAHKVNGWDPSQKRKGIRKKAILQFLEFHNVDPDSKTLSSIVKMCQRHFATRVKTKQISLKNIGELVSF